MINLVKNELIKIFHKKGLYIYIGIIILILGIGVISYKDMGVGVEDYSYYKDWFEECSLNDQEMADNCMYYINTYDTRQISKDYDYYSPEYYYINHELSTTINDMNYAKYLYKDDELYNEKKALYDEQIAILKNFDWRAYVNKQKEEDLLRIEELKEVENSADEMKILEYRIEGFDYRLKNDVAPTYKSKSYIVDEYVSSASRYDRMSKDESTYKSREELMDKRIAEKDFELSNYKIKNNIVYEDNEFRDSWLSSLKDMVAIYVIAILIIGGGLFSEEFNKGTIKQLLTKPFSRIKIYISKVIALFISFIIFLVVYMGISFIAEFIMKPDISSLFNPIYVYSFSSHSVVTYNTFSYLLLYGLLPLFPMLIIIGLLCVFVGILCTNTIGAILVPLGIILGQEIITPMLSNKMLSFLVMKCWDFSEYITLGVYSNKYMSLGLSICVCIITTILLIVFGIILFNNKDVKNQ